MIGFYSKTLLSALPQSAEIGLSHICIALSGTLLQNESYPCILRSSENYYIMSGFNRLHDSSKE